MAIDLTADQNLFMADFGETVLYRPVSGRRREILAIVDRDPPSMFGEVGSTPTMHLTIKNVGTDGIDMRSINTGGDQIDVAERYGETATARKLVRIVRHDAALVVVEVR